MSVINIVAACNEKYLPHVGAMLHSLFERNPEEKFSVYFLHRKSMQPNADQRLLELCERSGAEFTSRAVDPQLLEDIPVKGFYVEEAWYRVFMSRLLPELSRVLWLDADVIVCDSIRDLWDTDLNGKALAACPNAILYQNRDLLAALGIADRSDYFNTGVLLMDLASMRANDAESLLRQAVRDHYQDIQFADQDVLNCVYHRDYKKLDLKWNFLTHSYINVPETIRVHGRDEFEMARRCPKIIHFTGPEYKKPWSYRCGHPYREEYLRHREAAGWPAPIFSDKSLRTRIARSIPLRLREIINLGVRGRFEEMRSYIHPW